MTVKELANRLNELVDQGQGQIEAVFVHRYKLDVQYKITDVQSGYNRDTGGPLVKLGNNVGPVSII